MTGLAGGEVSSPVAGMKYINWGYGSAILYNPFKSVILMGEEQRTGYSVWA